jgi:tetratricopeptide (TPR) repeat protein
MIAWALVVALLAPPAPAPAPAPSAQDEAQARELYQAGSQAYEQARYDVAIRAFEEARRLSPHSAVTFSLAQAYRLQYFVDRDLAKLERAVELYRAYLDEVPEGGRRDHAVEHLSTLTPLLESRRLEAGGAGGGPAKAVARLIVSSHVEGATARVDAGEPAAIPAAFEVKPGPHRVVVEAADHLPEKLETVAVAGSVVALNVDPRDKPGHLTVRGPEGAHVAVDGRAVGESPLGGPLEVAPGHHLVAVTDRGREPFVEQVDVAHGGAAEVDAHLAVTRQRIYAWSLFGVAGALAAGAGVAFGFALDKESQATDLEKTLRSQGFTVAQAERYRTLQDDRDSDSRLAIGLGIGAGVAAAAGLVLYVFDTPEAPRLPVLTPTAGPSGAGVSASLPW